MSDNHEHKKIIFVQKYNFSIFPDGVETPSESTLQQSPAIQSHGPSSILN